MSVNIHVSGLAIAEACHLRRAAIEAADARPRIAPSGGRARPLWVRIARRLVGAG